MAYSTCPGQDRRFWKPDDIFEEPCPDCGAILEFWKDDVQLRCGGCGVKVANPRFDPGCARWCPYAEECLGDIARSFLGKPEAVRDRLESALRRLLGMRPDLVDSSLEVAELGERLIRDEGGSALLVIAASLLYQLPPGGIAEALKSVRLDKETVDGIGDILSGKDSPEFRVFSDARNLAAGGDAGQLRTGAARRLAAQLSTGGGRD